jgi:hypothetical protein
MGVIRSGQEGRSGFMYFTEDAFLSAVEPTGDLVEGRSWRRHESE